ncbi:nuclear transport factor 2 family protein [Mycobacterium sp. shizuoka-1]|uniref:nuclear transport factor 2 family protein n=1 Tax=Mycobacterium sp. shizuoka-1 TaxID=2039281 RepID=UPI000C0668A2|nr:nuclear transport factor 2 family protein [Mycobacterium sp. shizuoka-1]GAY15486.1 ketosteroid isomerase [Mycobacterium sp. shizuoka-1]
MAAENRIRAAADQLFAAITAGDVAAVSAQWSDDITVWRQGGGRERDKARALKVIDWFVSVTSDRRYEILDRHVFDGGFVQQHILHCTTGTGETLALRVCLVVQLGEDDLIRRIDEYLDPAELSPLLP